MLAHASREVKMISKNKIRKTISIDPILFRASERAAIADKRTFSNIVTILLEKFLNEKK